MTSCGDKDNARLSDIPAATADPSDEADGRQDEQNGETDTSDRTEETDREEIKNNLRDARDLIESGDIEDASMIIKGLQTRELTPDEEKELKALQKQMIKVSD